MRINAAIRETIAFFGGGDTVEHHDHSGRASSVVIPALMGTVTGTFAAGLACVATMSPGAPNAWAVGISAALGWAAGYWYTRSQYA